jgi:hypothetical protein
LTNADIPETVQLRLLSDFIQDSNDTFSIQQAWLPMMVLQGIEVIVKVYEDMTMMERFVIEALLALKRMHASELQEIASIPTELALWLLTMLKHKGLVYELEESWYRPDVDRCTDAIEQRRIPMQRSDRIDCLWFPESREIVVVEKKKSKSLFRDLRRLNPGRRWPVPSDLQGTPRKNILINALEEGRIYGITPQTIQEVKDVGTINNDMLPAYICKATVAVDCRKSWRLSLIGLHPLRQEGGTTTVRSQEEVALPVPLLQGLVNIWQDRITHEGRTIANHLLQKYGFSAVTNHGMGFHAMLSGDAALSISQEHILNTVFGVHVRISDELECELPLTCQPSDKIAEKLFEVDMVVRDALHRVPSEELFRRIPRQRLYERLWQLKLFKSLYDLREAEDFVA